MQHAAKPLRRWLLEAERGRGRALLAPGTRLTLDALADTTGLGALRGALADRNVLVSTGSQLAAAEALVELDGLARRIVLAPPDLTPTDIPAVMAGAGIDAAEARARLARTGGDIRAALRT